MKLRLYILLILSMFLFTKCKSPGDQIKDAFVKVDKSLKSANEALDISLENIYKQIDSKRSYNQGIASKADILYFATIHVGKLLDSLKQVMLRKDTTGTNIDLATKLLIDTKTGSDLTEGLLNVYNQVNSSSINSSSKKILDSTLHNLSDIKKDKTWIKKYFEATPTIAAVTILTKLKNDCFNAAAIVLKDVSVILARNNLN